MPLTITSVKNALPGEKDYKIADSKGLYLLVKPNGAKYWRFKYRFNKKEKLLAIGVFPETTLHMARQSRDEARKILADGNDPMEVKKSGKQKNDEDIFEGEHEDNAVTQHALIGKFIHLLNDQGDIEYQGVIEGVDGSVVLVQLFSFMTGEDTWIEPVLKSLIYSNRAVIYANSEDMNHAYYNFKSGSNHLINRKLPHS